MSFMGFDLYAKGKMMQFQRLMEPVHVGSMKLRNRIAMPPMTMCYADDNGGVSQKEIDYPGLCG